MSSGYLLLEGGAEFGGRMAEPDLRAIALAGGSDAPIRIIPAAAAPDNNHRRAGQNGVRWFESLGARDVQAVPLIDRASAADPLVADALRSARLIYLLGGFTHYLAQTLLESAAWCAALEAFGRGAVIAGSSAGAMVLCEHYYHPREAQAYQGLGLLPRACVLPHHGSFGHRWAEAVSSLLPEDVLVGIDERTGMIDEVAEGAWRVYGQGQVTLYTRRGISTYPSGATFCLPRSGSRDTEGAALAG